MAYRARPFNVYINIKRYRDMIITDKAKIISELHKVLSNDYPGVFHIKYSGENYRGSHSSLSYASVVTLSADDTKAIQSWKDEIAFIMEQGVTLHYIVDITVNTDDETADFEDIIDFAITRYELGGGFLICNRSDDVPAGMIRIVLIFGKLREAEDSEYLPEEMGLDSGREYELEGPIDFEKIIKYFNQDE